ncbi:ABC transporter substrate-binding protein [Roseomonas sp. BN140053]|uniref:ABC transporter substrate-binding protein n=1 Tax=Roseomonas sp. BN140053 TaxID=3391898 RepID=UPI0039E82EFE
MSARRGSLKTAGMTLSRRHGLCLALRLPTLGIVASLASAPRVLAQAGDPAAATVERLHAALLAAMQQATALGVEGRYRQLTPAVGQAFDFPAMTRFAVGSRWASFSAQEQETLVAAFTRYSVASYAKNFDGFSGQSFQTQRVEPRGEERIVVTRLNNPGSSPVDLTYRMQQSGGAWKIVDVTHDNISEMAIRRSEFSASVREGGAALLLQRLNELSNRLMQG